MRGSHSQSDTGVHPSGIVRGRFLRPLALLAVAWTAACGGDGGTQPEPAPQPNRPPVASGSLPAQSMTAGDAVTVNVAAAFTDPDGDALTYTAISSNAGVASAALSGTNLTVTAVSAGVATVTVTARDPAGLSAAASANITVMEPNRAPVAAVAIAPPQTAVVGDTVRLDASPFFTDPDGDALTYSANSTNTSVATVSVEGSVVVAAAVGVGSTTLTVTATDPDGLTGSLSVPVAVEPNRPPEATVDSIPLQTIEERDSVTVRASSYFTDPNGDALTYAAESSDAGGATVSVSGGSVTIRAVAIGTATLTVTAADPDGLTASLSGSIAVVKRQNRAPEAQGGISDVTRTVGWSGTLDLEGEDSLFVDPDGDDLTYSAESSDPSVVAVSTRGSVLSISTEAVGTAVATVTATDPDGLSASVTFDVTVLPAAGMIFRDDFDDDSSLDNWTIGGGTDAEVAEGILRLTNASDTLWGIAALELETPVTSWEVRARVGRQADSVRTGLVMATAEPGDRNVLALRFEVGSRVLNFGADDTETVNYALLVFFEPEGREAGWYYITGRDGVAFRGISDAINDDPGELTEITVRVQDGIFEALAGTETLFSIPFQGLSFSAGLPAITEAHLWSYDPATTDPSLLDWIEVNGVPTESNSTNADGAYRYRPAAPSDFKGDIGVVREAPTPVVGEVPGELSLTPGRR